MAYITFNAVIVDSITQTSTGTSSIVVSNHTNYMMIQSDDGQSFSYPSVFIGTNGTEFNSGAYAPFILQGRFWYLGANGYLWQYIQNNIVADVSKDIIGYDIQEAAGQPSAISLKLANANNKWVGSSPTGAGASAIARNRKIVIWQGYYNANTTPEAVPRNVYYIDDILQNVSSTKNDVTLVGRDFYKKLKTTVTKFSYQFIGPTFFSDIFDGSLRSSWNIISGSWNFYTIENRLLLTGVAGDNSIMLVSPNQNSHGHLMRVFLNGSGDGTAHIYAFYINSTNWLRLELDLVSGTGFAVKYNIAGAVTTTSSGNLPFTMTASGYYGIYIRRYDYYRFSFVVSNGSPPNYLGDQADSYDPAKISYVIPGTYSNGEVNATPFFIANPSWQNGFSIGFGGNSISLSSWKYFMFSTFTLPNDLSHLIRKIARIAGIFTFKISYTFKELFYTPNLTGTYSVNNRKLKITSGNTAVSNTNTFSNGEISFKAKITIANTAVASGFRFIFRADSNTPTNAYYLHVIRDGTGTTYYRFERLISAYSGGTTIRFYNSVYDVSNNPMAATGSLNIDLTRWHTYRVIMIDGWMYAFVDDIMIASWNDNNSGYNFLTTGNWGFNADSNTTLQAKEVTAPDFWKPVQAFSLNPGDDTESAIESLISSLRGWIFSDLLGRFKAIFLGSSNPSTYTYNSQLFQQNVDGSDKEYVAQVTVYGSGVMATARNTTLMSGVPTRDLVIVDYTIITYQDAQTRANNELVNRNQYQNQYTPKQFINVGAEIFDAITITNIGNNTTGVNANTRVYSQEIAVGGGNNSSDYSLSLDTGNL
jgi:hypothetical protein